MKVGFFSKYINIVPINILQYQQTKYNNSIILLVYHISYFLTLTWNVFFSFFININNIISLQR